MNDGPALNERGPQALAVRGRDGRQRHDTPLDGQELSGPIGQVPGEPRGATRAQTPQQTKKSGSRNEQDLYTTRRLEVFAQEQTTR